MLMNYESPLERNLYLDIDSDSAGGVAEGQDLGQEEAIEPVEAGESVEPESFYSYEFEDGDKKAFKDTGELNEYMRSGTLRHSDYTRKTQEVAEQRKSYEAKQAKYDAEYTSFLTQRQEHDALEKQLKSLPPEVYSRLKQGIQNQPKQPQTDPRLDKFLKEQEGVKKEQQESAMRNKAFESLSHTYKDFDKESVMAMSDQLRELAPGDEMRAFMELLHFAKIGKENPAETERRLAQNLERKRGVHTPMGNTNSVPNNGNKTYANSNEAAEAARREFG